MKNFKTLILLTVISIGHLSNAKAMQLWQKILPFVTADISYPLFTQLAQTLALPGIEKLYIPCTTAALGYSYISYTWSNTYKTLRENSPAFYNQSNAKKTEQWIKDRFNKNKTITDLPILTIENGPEEARLVKDDTSQYLLQLSKKFSLQEKSIQKGLIAHEETHFSQNHHAKLKQNFIAALTVTSLVITNIPAMDPDLYTLAGYYFCLPVYMANALETKLRRKLEKEADTFNKTPEELLGLIKLFTNTTNDNKKIADLLSSDNVENFAKKHFKERIPFFKKPFIDTSFPLTEERLTYLALQLIKQINNPEPQDIPASLDECKEALSCYFDSNQDYIADIPKINCPVVQKRVDFLRAKLIELENKKA